MNGDDKVDDRGRRIVTPAEREANKAFRKVDAEKAMTEHDAAQKAFYTNRDRLKAERLGREADSKLKEEQ